MPSKKALKAVAVAHLVTVSKMERAGQSTGDYYRNVAQPAVEAAVRKGCTRTEIIVDSERIYGQWLINNAGK